MKDLTYQAYLAAGAPTLDELTRRMEADDEQAACPSRDTIARLIGAPEPPARQADAVALVKVLTTMAGGDASTVARHATLLLIKIQMAVPLGRRISELDPYALEVHRAVALEGHTGLTPYVEREHDLGLRALVDDAVAGRSRLVMLVGASSTGKTRACWEALKQLPADWRLWHPIDPDRPQAALADLERVGPRTVVWLNEAHHYLLSRHHGEAIAAGLRTLLADDSRAPVLVLGTIWAGLEYVEPLTRTPALNEPDPYNQARRLLAGQQLHVPSSFEHSAIEALRTSADPRLAAAARFASDGMVAQYLAGAPDLLTLYNAAGPETRALLQAAMDARRLGHPHGIPLPFLAAAAEAYLTDTDWDLADDNWLEQALAALTTSVKGARGPLHPLKRPRGARTHDPRLVPQAYRLADYLDQYGRTERLLDPVPELFWQAARTHCSPETAGVLASEAANRGVTKDACALWIRAERYDLAAELLAEAGRLTEALGWFERAVSQGRTHCLAHAGDRLISDGRWDEALRWYERAFHAGHLEISRRVADQLVQAGLVQEALRWYEREIETDHREALPHAAQQLVAAGLLDQAGPPWSLRLETPAQADHWAAKSTEWYTKAISDGNAAALRQATDGPARPGHSAEALGWFEIAAQAGRTEALQLAAEHLANEGQVAASLNWCRRAIAAGHTDVLRYVADRIVSPGEMIAWYEGAAEFGDADALQRVADRLAVEGRLDEALDWYRRVADAGRTEALSEAAEHLANDGRFEEALDWYERAAAAGHIEALQLVADSHASMGDLETALDWYERAWAAGQPEAVIAAASELFMAGRQDESLRWYRRAAEGGHTEACVQAAVELVLADRHAEALQWCAEVVENAVAWSAERVDLDEKVAQQLAHLGCLEEALGWYDRTVRAGRTGVCAEVVDHLMAAGRFSDARVWSDRAAAAGSTGALISVGTQFAAVGRVDEALHWYQLAAEAGHTNALAQAATQLADTGRLDEALHWYQLAAEAGHTNALAQAATQLADTGRLDEALHWHERAAVAGASAPMAAYDVLLELGETDLAARLRAYGRTPEGGIAAAWTSADCE
ncbi:tetratricopeptide repeat protein [Streptomyces olivochromogenes]|uniref:tetratricopeptide repeat protein n=1 Tax=Streptomyces olivochromogenes TaxID=1963 RepID=UPI0036DAF043